MSRRIGFYFERQMIACSRFEFGIFEEELSHPELRRIFGSIVVKLYVDSAVIVIGGRARSVYPVFHPINPFIGVIVGVRFVVHFHFVIFVIARNGYGNFGFYRLGYFCGYGNATRTDGGYFAVIHGYDFGVGGFPGHGRAFGRVCRERLFLTHFKRKGCYFLTVESYGNPFGIVLDHVNGAGCLCFAYACGYGCGTFLNGGNRTHFADERNGRNGRIAAFYGRLLFGAFNRDYERCL